MTYTYRKSMAKKNKFNQNAAIRGALRRTFSRSPVVREVLMAVRREIPKFNKDGSRSKKDSVQYKCNVCGNWVGSTKVSVDHISPVITVEVGFVDWTEFVNRLFCGKENLQCLCDDCHQKKSKKERIARLCRKYGEDLDEYEKAIQSGNYDKKEMLKTLTGLCNRKKIAGLETIAERANKLKKAVKTTA